MKRLIWVLFGFIVSFAPVLAASFDCVKAASKIEKLVCDTPVLSMLDDELRSAYLEAIKKSSDEQKQGLVNDQKHWLTGTRNLCTDASCLKQAYMQRIDTLGIVSEKKTATIAKETQLAEPVKQATHGVAQTPSPPLVSLQEIQQLLNVAHKQLKARQAAAHDVLIFNSRKEGAAYCEAFWSALKTQAAFEIPTPAMIATSKNEKELIDSLHTYAKKNFDLYTSQDGNLTPEKYTDAGGRTWRLGPFIKGKTNDPKDLPKKFENAWQNNMDSLGFFDRFHLLDNSLSTHILFLQPYPIAGYARPLVITLAKDQCDKCTGISIGLRVVGVTGLPQPDLSAGEYFSQVSFADAATKANRLHTSLPMGPYLLMGIGVFNGKQIFWTLKQEVLAKASAKEVDENLGYEKGDGFRDFEIAVNSLDEPKYGSSNNICSVKFN